MNTIENNTTAANNNIAAATNTTMNTYKIDIADRTGHTTVADLSLDQAVDNIINNAENNARWVFINGEKFEFEGNQYRNDMNVNKLKGKLEALKDPAVLLTGVLVGGNE
jgi:hypothetical protein